MNIQEELKISQYQPVVGWAGTDEARIFQHWIQEYGCKNIPFICSLVYNLGVFKVSGMNVREEGER